MSEKKYVLAEVEEVHAQLTADLIISDEDGVPYKIIGQIRPTQGEIAVFEAAIKLLKDTEHKVRYGKPKKGEWFLSTTDGTNIKGEIRACICSFDSTRLIIDPPEPEAEVEEKEINELDKFIATEKVILRWLKSMRDMLEGKGGTS